jgi:hypothetical protein
MVCIASNLRPFRLSPGGLSAIAEKLTMQPSDAEWCFANRLKENVIDYEQNWGGCTDEESTDEESTDEESTEEPLTDFDESESEQSANVASIVYSMADSEDQVFYDGKCL